MKRIDDILELENKCTGCMACVDACPSGCIFPLEKNDGFKYAAINVDRCINCGRCYAVCPVESNEKHKEKQQLFAAYANDPACRNAGSSGGIFALLAEKFLCDGYYVCGAAFEGTTLKHRIVKSTEQIAPLLKSKYLQSNTEGIYVKIRDILKDGGGVFFCGTPCQVSALINFIPVQLRERLFTADIICHGVPSQKVFDDYIATLEKEQGGKVTEFSFRVKNNKYRHAHGYAYTLEKNEKTTVINGVYTQSSFYNAFKNYLIFRNGCYDCQYATVERVSDITLADFWGIEKYDFKGNVDAGVSMIITNTEKGSSVFAQLKTCATSKELPLQYGVDSNFCLTHSTQKPKDRDIIMEKIAENGYEQTAKEYFRSSLIHRIYWCIPPKARTFIRKIRGN